MGMGTPPLQNIRLDPPINEYAIGRPRAIKLEPHGTDTDTDTDIRDAPIV